MNLLLVHGQAEVREILRFGIEARYTIRIVEAANPEEAVELITQYQANNSAFEILQKAKSSEQALEALRECREFNLIVGELGPNVAKITTCLKDLGLPTPFVLWNSTTGKFQKGLEDRIHSVLTGKDILPDILRILDDLQAKNRFEAVEGARATTLDDIYCPIATPLLIRVSPLKSDIYIRLSEKKYVRLFPEGETFDLDDLKRYYKEKQVEHLYLHRDEVGEFLAKFRNDLEEIMQEEPIDIPKASKAVEEAHETMQEMLRRTGFENDVQDIAKQSVKLTMKVMSESPELSTILNRLKEGKEKYITSHSMLLAHVACAISASMTWNSSATYEKLTMAALLHDVTIRSQEIAAIETLEELESRKKEFSEEDIRSYKNHTIEASMMVRKMNKIPADVDAIIVQHHERADGTGFPRGLSHTHIGHLTCLFIIAHDMTRELLRRDKGFSLDEFIGERKNAYTKGNFRKIFEVLVKEMVRNQDLAVRPPTND